MFVLKSQEIAAASFTLLLLDVWRKVVLKYLVKEKFKDICANLNPRVKILKEIWLQAQVQRYESVFKCFQIDIFKVSLKYVLIVIFCKQINSSLFCVPVWGKVRGHLRGFWLKGRVAAEDQTRETKLVLIVCVSIEWAQVSKPLTVIHLQLSSAEQDRRSSYSHQHDASAAVLLSDLEIFFSPCRRPEACQRCWVETWWLCGTWRWATACTGLSLLMAPPPGNALSMSTDRWDSGLCLFIGLFVLFSLLALKMKFTCHLMSLLRTKEWVHV